MCADLTIFPFGVEQAALTPTEVPNPSPLKLPGGVQFHDILYTSSPEMVYTSVLVLESAGVGKRCRGSEWKFGNSVLSLCFEHLAGSIR